MSNDTLARNLGDRDSPAASRYQAIDAMRESGEIETTQTERCARGCLLLGHYRFRGNNVLIAAPFKTSPAVSSETGLPRRVWGRMWVNEFPDVVLVGCDHTRPRLRPATLGHADTVNHPTPETV